MIIIVIKFKLFQVWKYNVLSLIQNRGTKSYNKRLPTEIHLNLKPACSIWSKGRQVKKGKSLRRTSNQSRQKDQQEFTSTCGNFLFDQEKPYRKRKGVDDKSLGFGKRRTFSTLRLINRELKKKEREKNYLRYNKIG